MSMKKGPPTVREHAAEQSEQKQQPYRNESVQNPISRSHSKKNEDRKKRQDITRRAM